MSDFNKIFRAPNRVEILIPFVSGVDSYNLQTSLLPISGPFVDRAVINNVPESATNSQFRNRVFFRFDPDDFVADLDKRPFYVQLEPVTGGVPGTPGPVNAISPASASNVPPEVIQDAAPVTATRIPFSRTAISLSIVNLDVSEVLFVSFEEGGPEFQLPAQGDEFNDRGNFDEIFVRSSGGGMAMVDFQVVAILSSGDGST